MNPAIKLFIEHTVDILEADPVDFFFKAWQASNILWREDVAYMSTMLSEAGIEDVEENRELALLKALDTQMEVFGVADGGVSAMPVYDFIQADSLFRGYGESADQLVWRCVGGFYHRSLLGKDVCFVLLHGLGRSSFQDSDLDQCPCLRGAEFL